MAATTQTGTQPSTQAPPDRRVPLVAGIGFAVLAALGNGLQGSTPALHGNAQAVADFYAARPTLIAVGMSLSLVAVAFLACFLAVLRREVERVTGPEDLLAPIAWSGGVLAMTALSCGFALNAAGALRARAEGSIPAESAVVFYDGGLALSGLAATLGMAVLLAPTAVAALRHGLLPRWAGWVTAALALLGVVTPLSFLLFLLFPLWVLGAGILLFRRQGPVAA